MLQSLFYAVSGLGVIILTWTVFSTLNRRNNLDESEIPDEDEIDRKLRDVKRVLNLDHFNRHETFGLTFFTLRGTFRNHLQIDIEVYTDSESPFMRVAVQQPHTLGQGLRILSDRHSDFKHWLLRLREIEIGLDKFDRDFILLSRYPSRLEQILSPGIRFPLSRLGDLSDGFKVSDRSLFFYKNGLKDAGTIVDVVKKLVELGERLSSMASQLGSPGEAPEARDYQAGSDNRLGRGTSAETKPREPAASA